MVFIKNFVIVNFCTLIKFALWKMYKSMIESIFYNVGIYCRLSLDDGSVVESGSIKT